MFTRMEIGQMNDTSLKIAYDGAAGRLADDIRAGQPGRLSDVYDLALLRLEADLRCLALAPVRPHGQLSLLGA